MRDLYLEAMLHGEIPTKRVAITSPKKVEKTRFEVAIDKNIEQILNCFTFDDGPPGQIQLISPQMKRKKAEDELRESFKNSELDEFIETAMTTLIDEGREYLESATYEEMVADFKAATAELNQLNLDEDLPDDLNKILHISAKTIEAIYKIALAKFEEEKYAPALALFVLLTLLQPEDFDYWYRTGIIAQLCQNYKWAVNAYENAAICHPESIGARLFATECHLALNQRPEAEAEYAEAKKISETISLEENWREIFKYIGTTLSK